MLPENDTGLYYFAGAFTILVFAVAIAAVIGRNVVGLTTGTLLTLTAGFLIFMGVYFVSMAIYRGIERRERAE